MRITGGIGRGLPLKTPRGDGTRPATDRMRESVFSSLGPLVEGAGVIDLFAGTGAYGLEALSRGAAWCRFVEKDRHALAALQANLAALQRAFAAQGDPEREARVICGDARTAGLEAAPGRKTRQVLVFIDPPYALVETVAPQLMARLAKMECEGEPIVIFEASGDFRPDFSGWSCRRQLGKGKKDAPGARIYERVSS